MGSRLVNIRLDPLRQRKVKRLRDQGVALSDLVREAIDARFEAVSRTSGGASPVVVVRRILEAHPDPVDQPGRSYDVHDRAASRREIVAALKGRRGDA